MDTLRYKIYFKDRVGMVLDISHIVSSRNINIVSLQVLPNNTFLELEPLANKVREELEQEFRKIPGVINVVRIEVMPFEERERQLKTVLDSVSEGIIAIDKDGLITTFNPVCERILHYRASEVIGKHISTVLSPDIPMLQALQHGKTYDNYEITVKTPGGRANYLSSSRLIRDNHGKIMGVVAAIKDMPKVREMAYAIIKPAEITFEDIVGVSEGIERVKTLARLVASSDSTVLIRGESGTGKELFARAIYAASQRRGKPFIPVNCAALPDTDRKSVV